MACFQAWPVRVEMVLREQDPATRARRAGAIMAEVSVNYGVGLPKDAYTEEFLAGACPIVGSYGAKDRANRGNTPSSTTTRAPATEPL
jgi:hypothetical protein